MAEGFPRGKLRLRGSHIENFQERSRETRKRSREMAVNGVRDQDRLDGASNLVV